jgi:hypothetical protein
MPQTIEAFYHDGIVELKRKPQGIRKAKALVIFLESEKTEKLQGVDLDKVKMKASSVDKWVGIIAGAELGDWKAERRLGLEGKVT